MTRIISLELYNFANVYTGLGKSKVILTFPELEHMFLFMGANGSGKSSIMSCIHPFAYNYGTISSSKVIREGHDGKKHISIECNGFIYDIEHSYIRKKDDSMTVKSFIKKDGVELNSSGTVNTFKDIVESELGITETFLTLLSLGNRTHGFVEFTASERKMFITKVFQELDICTEKYKLMTTKERAKKALLNNVVSKLAKYKNIDRRELLARKDEIDNGLQQLTHAQAILNQDIGAIQNQLDSYRAEISKYKELQQEVSSILNNITRLDRTIQISSDIKTLNIKKCELEDSIYKDTLDITKKKAELQSIIDSIDTNHITLETVDHTLFTISTDACIEALSDRLEELTREYDSIHVLNEKIYRMYSKEYLIKASIYLNELNSLCTKVVSEVDSMTLLKNAFYDKRKNTGKEKEIEDKYTEVKLNIEQTELINRTRLTELSTVTSVSCESSSGCAYKQFYDNYMKILHKQEQEVLANVKELRSTLESVSDMRKAYHGVNEILSYINKNGDHFNVPKEVFDINTFLTSFIDHGGFIYDTELLQSMISDIEAQERKNEIQKEKTYIDSQMETAKKELTTKQSLIESKRSIEDTLEELESRYETMKASITELDNKIQTQQTTVDILSKDISTVTELLSLREKLSQIKKQMSDMEDKMKRVTLLSDKLEINQAKKSDNETKIHRLQLDKESISVAISEITSLESEELEIRKDYDNIKEIRDALSPTKGIPVEFVDYYFRSVMVDEMNELLDTVYNGNFRLVRDGLIIDDSSFLIPYKKGNTIISDISQASDGERAIITLAFSLVLMKSALYSSDSNKDVYNIMLLDEMDTSLDHNCRGKFIDLLEAYRKIIKSHQMFTISHNNMFDNYKLTVFLTSDMNVTGLKQANIVKLF